MTVENIDVYLENFDKCSTLDVGFKAALIFFRFTLGELMCHEKGVTRSNKPTEISHDPAAPWCVLVFCVVQSGTHQLHLQQ